jgi:hypothetical protein
VEARTFFSLEFSYALHKKNWDSYTCQKTKFISSEHLLTFLLWWHCSSSCPSKWMYEEAVVLSSTTRNML